MCEKGVRLGCTTRHSFWRRMRRRKLRAFLICVFLVILLRIIIVAYYGYCVATNVPIDVVYTWVNGSDPSFVAQALKFGNGRNFDPPRYDDKNELRYALRSLEKHAQWVRHIYIVSNHIPYWLDLSYERVTVVPHEVLAPNAEFLPTFSSSAIETFIHRIPKLSKRFLYLNDDIFLGTPLFPEDLYTESEGTQIYQAWMVPDCANDCPWTYIGDGTCDHHCNIAACQFDGGDCSASSNNERTAESSHGVVENEMDGTNFTMPTVVRGFPLRKKKRRMKIGSIQFKEIVQQRNLTSLVELQQLVNTFNKELSNPKTQLYPKSTTTVHRVDDARKPTEDIYSQSLIYTNRLLNRHYGFKARNVLAHVGFLLDREILDAMQAKFAKEIVITQSHRFRDVDDLQFAFAYYTFLMSEQKTLTVEEIFDEIDTDQSGTWSDREVRIFMTRMFPVLDWPAMHFFEDVIANCSRSLLTQGFDVGQHGVFSTLAYERYEDSNLPTITRELVVKCPLLSEAMSANLAVRSKYKYKIKSKRNEHNNFMMLTSNVSEVNRQIDKIRRNPRKFNCINDNLDPNEDNAIIRNLLEDFYVSFFPHRSKFELPPHYRNRFSTWSDYIRWRRKKRAALAIGYSATALLVFFILRFLCQYKAKLVSRCVQVVWRA